MILADAFRQQLEKAPRMILDDLDAAIDDRHQDYDRFYIRPKERIIGQRIGRGLERAFLRRSAILLSLRRFEFDNRRRALPFANEIETPRLAHSLIPDGQFLDVRRGDILEHYAMQTESHGSDVMGALRDFIGNVLAVPGSFQIRMNQCPAFGGFPPDSFGLFLAHARSPLGEPCVAVRRAENCCDRRKIAVGRMINSFRIRRCYGDCSTNIVVDFEFPRPCHIPQPQLPNIPTVQPRKGLVQPRPSTVVVAGLYSQPIQPS